MINKTKQSSTMSDEENQSLTIDYSDAVGDDLREEYSVKSPRVVNKKQNQCKYCFIFSLVITIMGVCILFLVPGYEHFQESNVTLPEPSMITGRVGGGWPRGGFHSLHHKYYCYDGGYDCCYIYGKHTHKINPKRVVGRDESGSNCPSLVSMINNYNNYIDMYFNPKNCSEVECCKIDASRDSSLRTNQTITNDIYEIKEEVCPTISTMIYKYEDYYPDPNSDTYFLIGIVCFILFLGVCLPDKSGRY